MALSIKVQDLTVEVEHKRYSAIFEYKDTPRSFLHVTSTAERVFLDPNLWGNTDNQIVTNELTFFHSG